MKKHSQLLLILLLFIFNHQLSFAQEKYTFEYKFKLNENLQYKTEKHDSMTMSMPDGQNMTNISTSYSLETLAVKGTPPDTPFSVSITVDTVWSDSENNLVQNPGNSNQHSGRRIRRRSFIDMNQNLKFNKFGKSATDESISSSLILPLPEKPVSVNDTWTFKITTKGKGRFKGETVKKGKCLLYDVQKNNGRNVAVFIINYETKGKGKFNVETQGRKFSGTNRRSATSSSLVYFDIDKGRIEEIVTEEESESATESSMFSSNNMSTSKSTIKLVK